jgi:hypothetical protein
VLLDPSFDVALIPDRAHDNRVWPRAPSRAPSWTSNPVEAAHRGGVRQVFYYADTARALARIGGRDREAIRFLLTAERIAPQHVRTSAELAETTRVLLDRSRRQAGGAELRGLCERMQTG